MMILLIFVRNSMSQVLLAMLCGGMKGEVVKISFSWVRFLMMLPTCAFRNSSEKGFSINTSAP